MSTTIYWFSATGNSLQAAKELAVALGGAGQEGAELWPMMRGRFPLEGERVVFCFPLYFQSMPLAVRAFLDDFEPIPGTEHVAMVTRAYRPTGGVLRELDAMLRRKGSYLARGSYLEMPSDDVLMFSPTGEPAASARLAAAEGRIRREAAAILGGRRRIQAEPLLFIREVRRRFYEAGAGGARERFAADANCNGCGLCAKLCPLGRIAMEGDRPAWSPGCQLCEACVNWCPARAIQVGGTGSEAKGRYTHPAAKWKEIAAQRPS